MSTQNPQFQLPAQVPDLTSAFGVPTNDPLLPSKMNAGLANLQQAFGRTLGEGSFAGKHPILSTLLGTGGGALLGALAGGLDSDVGAGRGALLGALTGGVSTPLLERQRKNQLANTYMTLVPKLAEQQKILDEMRQKRAGGLMTKQMLESQGIDAGFMATPDGDIIPVSDAMAQIPAGYLEGTTVAEQAAGLMGGSGFQQGADIGRDILSKLGQAATLQGMAPDAMAPIMEIDPTVQPSAANPLRGGATMQAAPEIGSRRLMPVTREAIKDLLGTSTDQQKIGLQEAVDAPMNMSLAELRKMQGKEIGELLPGKKERLSSQAQLDRARASLANRTDPNLRASQATGDSNRDVINLFSSLRQLMSMEPATELDKTIQQNAIAELVDRANAMGVDLTQMVQEAEAEGAGFDLGSLFNIRSRR